MANITDAPILDSTGQEIVTKLQEIKNKISQGGGSGGGGTDDYAVLDNKPQINGVTLSGNKTLSQLGIQSELAFDNVPTQNSPNPVESSGVFDALADIKEVTAAQAQADWEAVFGEFSNYGSLIVSNNTSTLDSNNVIYDD